MVPKLFIAYGESKTIKEWSEDNRCLVPFKTLQRRLHKAWDPERAMNEPVVGSRKYDAFGESKTITEWTKDERCVHKSATTLRDRVKWNWDFEIALTKDIIKYPISAFGESKVPVEWAQDSRCIHKDRKLIVSRINQGWDAESAILEPRQNIKKYKAFNETKILYDWAKDSRCVHGNCDLLRSRLSLGWTLEDAISQISTTLNRLQAFGEFKSISDWVLDARCPYKDKYILKDRIYKLNWESEKAITTDIIEDILYDAFDESKKWSEWIKDPRFIGHENTVRHRLYRGMSLEEAMITEKINSYSLLESDLADFIESHIPIERSNRTLIAPLELDIYIPSKNIAIEFNGLYWHSEKFKSKNYHYDKYLACKNQGVQLIQIWEDDWNYKKDIVKLSILTKLNLSNIKSIYARKTDVNMKVKPIDAKLFYEQNHIQGFSPATHHIGLMYNNELVALASFKDQGTMADVRWDLVRFATSVRVPGGFSKILSHFKNYRKGDIKSFADLTISNGSLYETNGFSLNKILDPDYSYLDKACKKRVHKFNYRKEKFAHDTSLIYDATMTETELAELNGLTRIYDAGKIRYVWRDERHSDEKKAGQ